MAPALTQTAEPPRLADAARCHSPAAREPPNATDALYDNLTEDFAKLGGVAPPRVPPPSSGKVLIVNGDWPPSGLAPPAFGWAQGRPPSSMDEVPPITPVPDGLDFSLQVPVPDRLDSSLQVPVPDKGPPDELLDLVGRDFDNVNDIIDTLRRLASNPELLDAAAREELEPEPPPSPQRPLTQEDIDENDNGREAVAGGLLLRRLMDRQRRLERRRSFLLRRLRRVTARGLALTVSSQLNHLTRHVRALLEEARAALPAPKCPQPPDEALGIEGLHKESMRSMTTSDLISLVRRVEASHQLRRIHRAGLPASPGPPALALPLPPSICAQLDTVASEMRAAALTHAHPSHDSDATESSSGGESCDEDPALHPGILPPGDASYKPVRERAFYRYCRTRGWLASRWMWLQAQIADLDYRIVQQQRQHALIQKSKGAVHLMGETLRPRDRPPGRSPAHLDLQDPALTCIGTTTRTILNGYHPANKCEESSVLSSHSIAGDGSDLAFGASCARTTGVAKVKRRRYVRPSVALLKRAGIRGTTVNSTNKVRVCLTSSAWPVMCKCVPPLSCVLCVKSRLAAVKNNGLSMGTTALSGHKLGNAAAAAAAAPFLNQSVSELMSKIDLSFHPVLSRHSEMLQGEVYSAALRSTTEWRHPNKAALASRETFSNASTASLDHFEPLTKRKKEKEHKRNGRRKHLGEGSQEKITLKIRKSFISDGLGEQDREVRESNSRKRKFETRISAVGSRRSLTEDEGEEEFSGWPVSVEGSVQSSPCPSPAFLDKPEKGENKSGRKYSMAGRQKQNSTSNSYDINNIVIPYNMASTSRVELLQYKEIPTPKWRVQEITPLPTSSKIEELEEDISEEAILCRHSKSEELERKKFLTYLQTQVNSSRSSRSRRADSSGTNTPDHPLSPRPMEPVETSPIGSPPDTPILAPSEDSNQSSHASLAQSTVLTLSLSSLQSSVLKSNPNPPENDENNSSLKSYQKNTTPITGLSETPPALRTRRLLSGGVGVPSDRSKVIPFDEQMEKDRLSPFPCRNFPLNETELKDLMCENQRRNSHVSTPLKSTSNCAASSSLANLAPGHRHSLDEEEMVAGIDAESGRDSPLSELTDSAPEEEPSALDDGAAPDWTISVVNDHSGGVVLTVQRNE